MRRLFVLNFWLSTQNALIFFQKNTVQLQHELRSILSYASILLLTRELYFFNTDVNFNTALIKSCSWKRQLRWHKIVILLYNIQDHVMLSPFHSQRTACRALCRLLLGRMSSFHENLNIYLTCARSVQFCLAFVGMYLNAISIIVERKWIQATRKVGVHILR